MQQPCQILNSHFRKHLHQQIISSKDLFFIKIKLETINFYLLKIAYFSFSQLDNEHIDAHDFISQNRIINLIVYLFLSLLANTHFKFN